MSLTQDETSAPIVLESRVQDHEEPTSKEQSTSNGHTVLQDDPKEEYVMPLDSSSNDGVCQSQQPSQPETLELECKEVLQKDIASCDTHSQLDTNIETTLDVVSVKVESSENNIKSSKESLPVSVESLPTEQNNEAVTSGHILETPDTAVAAS
ncbi:uncharacterized protein [Procambarus clarkii]|uniref:uncharacterized protein n=1 Tax=Procambarus clarkii TaxID=6728 RepID=UPI0037447EC0